MLNKIIIFLLLILSIIYLLNNKFFENFQISNNNNQFKDNISLNLDTYDKKFTPNTTDKDLRNIAKNKGIDYNTVDYNQIFEISNNDLTYYYNDVINQSNINEDAYDIINQIDNIDYSNVKTGLDKCNKECSGTCFELGYAGIATCYPKPQQPFDWGTLYKNPTFTYGYNAYKPNNVNK